MFGASVGELSFAALLLVIVLLAQIAPRIGEAIGARLGHEGADPGPEGEPPAARGREGSDAPPRV